MRLLLALTVLLTTFPGECTVDCPLALTALSELYSRKESEPVTLSELKRSDWIVTPEQGLMQFDSYDAQSRRLTASIPGRPKSNVAILSGISPDMKVAHLGTAEAREIIAERTRERVGPIENARLVFAHSALQSIGNWKGQVGKRDPSILVAEQIWESIKHRHPLLADQSLSDILESAQKGHLKMGQAFLFDPPSVPKESVAYRALLDDMVSEYYRRTGVNLVQVGVLAARTVWHHDGTGHIRHPGILNHAAPFGAMETEHRRIGATATKQESMQTKWRGLGLPPDVVHELMVQSWKSSEDDLEKLGRSSVWLANYIPEGKDADAFSDAIRTFKSSGDVRDLEPVLQRAAAIPAFSAWKDRVTQLEGKTVLVGVPSAQGESSRTTALAHWLSNELGKGVSVDPRIQIKSAKGTKQAFQPALWGRIENMGDRAFDIPTDVSGKNIVLVEDVTTSGATIMRLKAELLKKGARSVQVFTVGKTNKEPETLLPELLLHLSNPVDTRPVARIEVPSDRRKIAVMVNEALAARRTLPWEGKAARDVSQQEKQLRAQFANALKERDLAGLYPLSYQALCSYEQDGRKVTQPRLGVTGTAVQIERDDHTALEFSTGLYRVRNAANWNEIKDSPISQLIVRSAKKRLELGGPFLKLVQAQDADFQKWIFEITGATAP